MPIDKCFFNFEHLKVGNGRDQEKIIMNATYVKMGASMSCML